MWLTVVMIQFFPHIFKAFSRILSLWYSRMHLPLFKMNTNELLQFWKFWINILIGIDTDAEAIRIVVLGQYHKK